MESTFQNNAVLYNFPEYVFSDTCLIRTVTNLDKGSLPDSPN
jgi:hypothetical protein